MLRDMHQAAIGSAPFAYTDTLGNNIARGLIGRVDHFRAGILVLTVTRQSDADHLAAGFAPFNTTPGYFIVSLDPILQSIHLISASCIANPRFLVKLKTLWRQCFTVPVLY